MTTTTESVPSRGRMLYELGRRFGTTRLDTVEASLFLGFMAEGGDYASPEDKAFQAWIDELDDPNRVLAEVAELLGEDPTKAGPTPPS